MHGIQKMPPQSDLFYYTEPYTHYTCLIFNILILTQSFANAKTFTNHTREKALSIYLFNIMQKILIFEYLNLIKHSMLSS